MSLRIKGLVDVDPLEVPLPHGTEVTTRVARVLGDRSVPSGSVGRVVGGSTERPEVLVVGVGRLDYARRELVPRKAGQVRYAIRREAAYEALSQCTILTATVGSRAWGLADAGSDTDIRGTFVLPFPWTTGLVTPPLDLASRDSTEAHWEIGKLVRQAMSADPNTLELLFVETAVPTDEMGHWLLESRDAFVSREIYGSFGRYALSQLARLSQSMRLAEHRGYLLDWLASDGPHSLDQLATQLADAIRPATGADSPEQEILNAKRYIKQLYRSLFDQGLLREPSFKGLCEFARTRSLELDLPRQVRPKNAYNLLRLLHNAIAWLRDGTVDLRTDGAIRTRLLDVKNGRVALSDVLAEAEQLTTVLDEARRQSPLPVRGDIERAEGVLVRIRNEAARRWIEQASGPFGRDAPPYPKATWSDE